MIPDVECVRIVYEILSSLKDSVGEFVIKVRPTPGQPPVHQLSPIVRELTSVEDTMDVVCMC